MSDKKSKIVSAIKILLGAIGVLVILIACLLIFCTANEYHPAGEENIDILDNTDNIMDDSGEFKLISWNTGYGGLGEKADFFMDGGSDVTTYDKVGVEENISSIADFLADENADFIFLQETDKDSARSYHIDEVEKFSDTFKNYDSAYARNFLVKFIPYPIPPIGKVDAGIETLSRYNISEAKRISLPSPFSWPVSTVNLKRCLLSSRLPIEGSDKELVLVNLHLEAYDDGSGKIAQTKLLHDVLAAEYEAGNYVIAGGDFNQTFSDVEIPTVYPDRWLPGQIETEDFSDGFSCLMDESTYSCRSLDSAYTDADKDSFQYYIIDGFIVSDNITVNAMHAVDLQFKNSDHNPVVLEFALK